MKRLIAGLGIAAALTVPALSACSASPPHAPIAKKPEACKIKTDTQGHVYCVTAAPHAQNGQAGSNDALLYWILWNQTANQPAPSSATVGSPSTVWVRASSAPSGSLTSTGKVDQVDEESGQPSNNPQDEESEAQAAQQGEETVDETSNPADVEQAVDPNVEAPGEAPGDNGNSGSDNGGDSGSGDSGGGDAGGGDGGGGGGGD